jgi:hypothetical protein
VVKLGRSLGEVEDTTLIGMFGPKGGEITGEWRKVLSEELED